jgi:enamine deaminase RidA (YjgF/YER057c/UK114 family)
VITDRIDPPELYGIPSLANVTIATGTRIVHISGQTGVDKEGKVAGSTHLDQCRQALRNLRIALEAGGATLADVAKIMIYMVDYDEKALEALTTAAIEEYGADFPITASTLVGVATLWQPDVLVEIDAVAVV